LHYVVVVTVVNVVVDVAETVVVVVVVSSLVSYSCQCTMFCCMSAFDVQQFLCIKMISLTVIIILIQFIQYSKLLIQLSDLIKYHLAASHCRNGCMNECMNE